jgi:hypothetical protein
MALINHSYKFVFVHIPKTAGTSVTSVLSRYTNYCDQEIGATEFGERVQPAYQRRFGLGKHSTAAALRNVMGHVKWKQYFSFAFVRDPFARCLSTYHFLRKWEGAGPEFARTMQGFASFDEYVLSGLWERSNGPDDIFRPQVHWLRAGPKASGLLVDFVGHVEKLEEGLAHVLSVIDPVKGRLQPPKVPRLNRSSESTVAEIRAARVIERIARNYADDFDAFGYPAQPAAAAG